MGRRPAPPSEETGATARASEARANLRWRLSEEDEAATLFPDETAVERHVGRGEYRGLEFLQVNARSIINRVPASSPVPFRYTINAHRGCSHACTYCVHGDTRVFMGDGTTKRMADVRKGDRVYGTVRRGRYRRYTVTEVLDHWSVIRPAHRTVLSDGTELVTSGDHRFLTVRGWKHVATTSPWGRTPTPTRRPRGSTTSPGASSTSSARSGIRSASSHRDEQIREVAEACRSAGAVSVTAVPLHLRRGVKEHWFAWLSSARPDLVTLHRRRFAGGAYQSPSERDRVASVAVAVTGRRTNLHWRAARLVSGAAPTGGAEVEQLHLP